MSFQFQCPQGHLLEGDPSQAGQAVNCPTCGMLFLIPAPLAAPAQVQPAFGPSFGAPGEQAASRFAHLDGGPAASPEAAAMEPSAPVMEAPAPPEEPELLHIPCPNGHELETPIDMLEQEVLCPKCNVQFRLRKKDSVEFKRKKEEADRLKEIKTGNFWLNMAIVAAVLVGLLVVGLIGLTILNSSSGPPRKGKKAAIKLSPRAHAVIT
jgi:hypothetical protein